MNSTLTLAQTNFEANKAAAIKALKEALTAIEAYEFPENGNWSHTGDMIRYDNLAAHIANVVLNREV